jgi:hypothetical protein
MGWLDRERTGAPPGFNRWLVPPAALAVHLCIGQAYATSVYKTALVKHFGASLMCGDVFFHTRRLYQPRHPHVVAGGQQGPPCAASQSFSRDPAWLEMLVNDSCTTRYAAWPLPLSRVLLLFPPEYGRSG